MRNDEKSHAPVLLLTYLIILAVLFFIDRTAVYYTMKDLAAGIKPDAFLFAMLRGALLLLGLVLGEYTFYKIKKREFIPALRWLLFIMLLNFFALILMVLPELLLAVEKLHITR